MTCSRCCAVLNGTSTEAACLSTQGPTSSGQTVSSPVTLCPSAVPKPPLAIRVKPGAATCQGGLNYQDCRN